MPERQRKQLEQFDIVLSHPAVCTICDNTFDASDTGRLSCSFHPSDYINHQAHIVADYETTPDFTQPSACTVCNFNSISPTSRSNSVPRPRKIDELNPCTRIDHCVDVGELLARPFVALPVFYLSRLGVLREAKAAFPMDPPLVALTRFNGALLVVDPPKLLRTLHIDIPHSAEPVSVPVQTVYAEMCDKFGLQSLEETVRKARRSNPIAMEDDAAAYAHADAKRRAQIHALGKHRAVIIPFVVLPRVSQETAGSVGIKIQLSK